MWIYVIPLLAILGVIVVLYNRLINSRNRVSTAWSDVDVQLQRRYDLIPRLVEAVDQYARYERSTLEAIGELRNRAQSSATLADRGSVETQLEQGVHKLIALAEDYPDLKANENFLSLQDELVETENVLQFARRYYNASVRDYNTMIETVPSNFVAGAFRFLPREFFQKASDDVASVPLIRGQLES
ncbi:MAG: LemA family protein [Pseudomonadota bacterium]